MRDIELLISNSPAPELKTASLRQAERLVFCIHEGVDWSIWGGARRSRYWDALADRVRAGTYSGPTLVDWWESVTQQIGSAPRDNQHRAMVTTLLYEEVEQREVLKALREHAGVLVMRVRVHLDAAKVEEE